MSSHEHRVLADVVVQHDFSKALPCYDSAYTVEAIEKVPLETLLTLSGVTLSVRHWLDSCRQHVVPPGWKGTLDQSNFASETTRGAVRLVDAKSLDVSVGVGVEAVRADGRLLSRICSSTWRLWARTVPGAASRPTLRSSSARAWSLVLSCWCPIPGTLRVPLPTSADSALWSVFRRIPVRSLTVSVSPPCLSSGRVPCTSTTQRGRCSCRLAACRAATATRPVLSVRRSLLTLPAVVVVTRRSARRTASTSYS